jgi:RNA polymerase sigma-70 factor (ECF subfamily)
MTSAEYNVCVDQLADPLYGFAYKYLKDSFEAENVVQNTFEKLWTRIDQVDTNTAKAFLYKIAYNNCIDLLRKSKREVLLEDDMTKNHLHTEQYTGTMEVVMRAVEKLPEKQKAVVMLRDYEGYDYKSIGEITGMTEAQVKINIFRARQFLKEQLKELRVAL